MLWIILFLSNIFRKKKNLTKTEWFFSKKNKHHTLKNKKRLNLTYFCSSISFDEFLSGVIGFKGLNGWSLLLVTDDVEWSLKQCHLMRCDPVEIPSKQKVFVSHCSCSIWIVWSLFGCICFFEFLFFSRFSKLWRGVWKWKQRFQFDMFL